MSYYLSTNYVTELSTVANDFNWPPNNITNDTDCIDREAAGLSKLAGDILYYLNTYYSIVIIFFGLIGNSISAAVFLGTQLRSRSSSYYLAALAISDSVFLVSLLLTYFNIESSHIFLCKSINYLSFVSTFLSVWLIVSFTIERFIAVQYPLQRPRMCTVKRAKFIVSGLMFFAFVSNVYIFFIAGLQESTDTCGIMKDYEYIMRNLNIYDMALTLALPILLIVVMNTMIAIQLYRFSRTYTAPIHVYQQSIKIRHQDHSDHDQSASSVIQPYSAANGQSGVEIVRIISVYQARRTSQSKDESSYRSHTRSSSSSKVLSQKMQFNITKMLLVISTVFIGLNLPSYVIRIYTMYNPEPDCNIQLTQQYFQLLFYTHFSINFLLYSIYGVAFRRALLSFACEKLRCRCFIRQNHVTCMYKCIHVISSRKS